MTAMVVPPVDLAPSRLTPDERATVQRLVEQLQNAQRHNNLMERYYEGKNFVRDLGIAIPPHLRDLEAVVGWPGVAVDSVEERLDHDGWTVTGSDQLESEVEEIVEANQLDDELGAGRLDALIYGIAYITAGTGAAGEPSPLVTIESPRWMTGLWNRRRRAIDAAMSVTWGSEYPGQVTDVTLYLMGETVRLQANGIGQWRVVDRDAHGLPFVPVWPLINRRRRGDEGGRSEITRAIRSVTDNAVRTVLGMEIHREFHVAPQRWIMGASESAFVGPDGKPKTAWETYLGRVLALEANERGETPEVGQFPSSSPSGYIEQLRALAQMAASESGVPVKSFGLVHESNPASADAALVDESRLNKRVERRQRTFGRTEAAAMRGALWIHHGTDPGVTPTPVYRPAATPTLAASADATQKLVSAGILPPHSDVTLRRIGLTEAERAQVRDDWRRERAGAMIAALSRASDSEGDVGDES